MALPTREPHRNRCHANASFLVDGKPVVEEDRIFWRKVLAQQGGMTEQVQQIGGMVGDVVMMAFNPRQARERAKDMAGRRARSRLYQRRDALETVLVHADRQASGHFARCTAHAD